MTAPLVERATNDPIPASDHNDVKDYIEDGEYRVNTKALEIQGTEAISEDREFKPAKIIVPASGLSFYDTDGVEIAKIDASGNLYLKGGVGSL